MTPWSAVEADIAAVKSFLDAHKEAEAMTEADVAELKAAKEKLTQSAQKAVSYTHLDVYKRQGSISTSTKDYIINYQDLQGIGMTDKLALQTLIAPCWIALGKPVVSNLAVLGDISISGTMIKVDELAKMCIRDSTWVP